MPIALAQAGLSPADLQHVNAHATSTQLGDQIAPATLNLEHPDPAAAGLDLVRGSARRLPMEYAISNGFGFGGVNASVIFRCW